MITLRCRFQSNGKTVRKTAILTDDLRDLSNSRRNDAYDINMECYEDGYRSVFFEDGKGCQYEVQLRFDNENRQKTLEGMKAVTWENDIITDVQNVELKVKY